MSKSNDKLAKENRELRRQIEILRAQIKSENIGKSEIITRSERVESQSKAVEISLSDHIHFVQKDLLKSVVLSSIIFAIIFAIYFSRAVN